MLIPTGVRGGQRHRAAAGRPGRPGRGARPDAQSRAVRSVQRGGRRRSPASARRPRPRSTCLAWPGARRPPPGASAATVARAGAVEVRAEPEGDGGGSTAWPATCRRRRTPRSSWSWRKEPEASCATSSFRARRQACRADPVRARPDAALRRGPLRRCRRSRPPICWPGGAGRGATLPLARHRAAVGRVGRRGGAAVRRDGRLSEEARAVRPDHRQLPGDQAPACRPADGARGDAGGGPLRRARPRRRARGRGRAVATAGAYVDDTFAHICGEALQLHGGIGFTWEHDVHLFARRAKVNQVLYGDGAWHRERLVV